MKIFFNERFAFNRAETEIEIISEYSLMIDGILYKFGSDSGEYTNIENETNGVITHAETKDSLLYITVNYYYRDNIWENPNWNNTGNFKGNIWHDFKEGDKI